MIGELLFFALCILISVAFFTALARAIVENE